MKQLQINDLRGTGRNVLIQGLGDHFLAEDAQESKGGLAGAVQFL